MPTVHDVSDKGDPFVEDVLDDSYCKLCIDDNIGRRLASIPNKNLVAGLGRAANERHDVRLLFLPGIF